MLLKEKVKMLVKVHFQLHATSPKDSPVFVWYLKKKKKITQNLTILLGKNSFKLVTQIQFKKKFFSPLFSSVVKSGNVKKLPAFVKQQIKIRNKTSMFAFLIYHSTYKYLS